MFKFIKSSQVFKSILMSYLIILLLLVFSGIFYYIKAGNIVKEQADSYSQAMLDQVREVVDGRLQDISQLSLQVSLDPEVLNYLEYKNVNTRNNAIWILDKLNYYKNLYQFIYDIYIYSNKRSDIISPSGKWGTTFFFTNIYSYTNINPGRMTDMLSQLKYNAVYWPRKQVYVGKWPNNMITYIKPIVWKSKDKIGSLVILLDEQDILNLMKNIQIINNGYGYVYIIDETGNIIASSQDDEIQKIPSFNKMALSGRSGAIEKKVNGSDMAITYTTSYITNWKYISIIPMGIILAKVDYIKNITIAVTLIFLIFGVIISLVLTNKNYAPVNQLIQWIKSQRLGSIGSAIVSDKDYNNEYEFIKKTFFDTYMQSKKFKDELDKRKSVLKANYLYKLLKGDVVKNDVSETGDFLNIDFRFLHFAVLVLQINYCGKFINSEGTPDKLLAKFAVSNIAVEVANKEVVSYAVELDNDLVALVLNVPWDVSQEGCYKVNNIARTIKEFLQENFGVVLTIGIGRIYSGIVNISKSYKDAIISFDYKIVKGKGKIITYSDVKINNESYYYPLDIEQQLINNVKAGDFNNLKGLLNSIFKENFEKRQLPYKLIQCLYFDIMSTAIKVLNEINIEYRDVFGKSFDPITELLNCDNVIDMYNEIVKIFEGICCHINKKKKSHNQVLLDRIIEHVQKNYMKVKITAQVDVDTDISGQYAFKYKVSLNGERICEEEFQEELLAVKGQKVVHEIELDNIKLWWPNGFGEHPLYDIELTISDKNNMVCDNISKRVGFRSVEFVKNHGSPENALPYTLMLNGKRIFLRGVDWVPISPFYGAVTEEDYKNYLQRFKDMNCNILRVWGGAILEKEAFYNTCDEMGIMVWQEFPQSSSGLNNTPPDDPDFLEKLKEVATVFIKRRRHHASHIIWCGGNELMWENATPVNVNHINIKMLKELVEQMDPGKHFLPSSASGPSFGADEKDFGKGIHHDVHGPWDYVGEPDHYRYFNGDDSLFRSETGCPAISRLETLEKYKGEYEIWPPDESNILWMHRGAWWIQMKQLTDLFGEWDKKDLPQYIMASRHLQAEALRYTIEATRRREPAVSGFIIWMGNEPYPNNANTSVIEYDGTPKPAYYWIKDAYSGLHVSLKYDKVCYTSGETFNGDVYVTYDYDLARDIKISAHILDVHGNVLYESSWDKTVSGPVSHIGSLSWKIQNAINKIFFIRLRLQDGLSDIDINTYVFTTDSDYPFEPLRNLPQSKVEVTRDDSEDGLWVIKNTSNVAAVGVFLYGKVPFDFIQFSKNYFILMPGEKRCFTVTSKGNYLNKNYLSVSVLISPICNWMEGITLCF